MLEKTVVVGKKYVVVIPAEIRKKIGLKEGDLLKIQLKDNKIILEPVTLNPFKILEEVIGEPYSEEKDEKEAEKWLKNACSRY